MLIGVILYMILGFASEAVIAPVLISALGYEKVNTIASGQTPLFYLMNTAFYGFSVLLALAGRFLWERLRHINLNNAGRVARSVLVPAALIWFWFRLVQREDVFHRSEHFIRILPEAVLVILALAASVTFIVQDIRYVRQSHLNSALLEQKKIQDALLQDTRVFRHNIVNLLYGFQGTVLSGNTENIRQYYERMASACRMINNENVAALERIPSLPVHALLLEKISRANDAKIPFYVYTDENLAWRGMKDPDMCEALGVLLDNAMEAAADSAAPMMILELHNTERDMEVVVRNTCRDVETAFSQAGKPGHEGLGLPSLRRILQRYPNAILNLFTQGRFAEAQMLLR